MKTIILAFALILAPLTTHALQPLQLGHFAGTYGPTGCARGWDASPGYLVLSVSTDRNWVVHIYDGATVDYLLYGRLSSLGRFTGITPQGTRFTGTINRKGELSGRWTGPPRTCHGTFAAYRTGP